MRWDCYHSIHHCWGSLAFKIDKYIIISLLLCTLSSRKVVYYYYFLTFCILWATIFSTNWSVKAIILRDKLVWNSYYFCYNWLATWHLEHWLVTLGYLPRPALHYPAWSEHACANMGNKCSPYKYNLLLVLRINASMERMRSCYIMNI